MSGVFRELARADPGGASELRILLGNDLGDLTRANERVLAHLGQLGCSERARYLASLALEELLSNVIRHAYEEQRAHVIALRVRVAAGMLELRVLDDGRRFDPGRAPAPDVTAPLEERRHGGLGIHLVRSLVGAIRHARRRGWNRVVVRLCVDESG